MHHNYFKKFISEIGKREVVVFHFVRDAKMTDNRQEQEESDRIMIENYCIVKKFIYQIGNLGVRNRQEQTGIYRIMYLI